MKRLFTILSIAGLATITSCTPSGPDNVTGWENYREATATSSAKCSKVYEYTPAPGQFINESSTPTTATEAAKFAEERLTTEYYVSLGGFGGYIVVGFDHSIPNLAHVPSGDLNYDFIVKGNPFTNSSEPGVVYVMQDTNGDGMPNDEWFELRGSEFGKPESSRSYEVTYYKPKGNGESVRWTDNKGAEGKIEYLIDFHIQNSYYPSWITADSYTLKGSMLKSRVTKDEDTGFYACEDYEWGYADNYGNDLLKEGTGFKIANAVNTDGKLVNLKFIDFIKVQNAVNASAGRLGEVSTEVTSFKSLHLKK